MEEDNKERIKELEEAMEYYKVCKKCEYKDMPNICAGENCPKRACEILENLYKEIRKKKKIRVGTFAYVICGQKGIEDFEYTKIVKVKIESFDRERTVFCVYDNFGNCGYYKRKNIFKTKKEAQEFFRKTCRKPKKEIKKYNNFEKYAKQFIRIK